MVVQLSGRDGVSKIIIAKKVWNSLWMWHQKGPTDETLKQCSKFGKLLVCAYH